MGKLGTIRQYIRFSYIDVVRTGTLTAANSTICTVNLIMIAANYAAVGDLIGVYPEFHHMSSCICVSNELVRLIG